VAIINCRCPTEKPKGTKMIRNLARAAVALAALTAAPAFALDNPIGALLTQGPVADFLNIFQEHAPAPRIIDWNADYPKGTVVISTSKRRLYYILGNEQAIEYGVGVGREGFTWSGEKRVSAIREWPGWTPPPQMLKRRPELPRYMPGGIDNPLGARAIYLGSSMYRIHGSNEPETIGAAVSSGCIRMTNRDVVDLADRVKVGTKVVVLR
jgi:lipoprotein-anchoring transpeptidase ErfK/SrfK